jgi:hypothetical protein
MSIRMDFPSPEGKDVPILYFVKDKMRDITGLDNTIILKVNEDAFEEVHTAVKAKLSESTLYEEQENVIDDDHGKMSAAYYVRDPAVAALMLDDIIEMIKEKATDNEMNQLEKLRAALK